MSKKFQTGDVVVDTYGRHGIVIKYDSHKKDTLLLLIKNGDYYNTLESLEHNWAWVGYYDEFKQILKRLGEQNMTKTKDEAINQLKNYKQNYTYMMNDDVVDMAIKALEQQPSEDCVSRQAVLARINDWWGITSTSGEPTLCDCIRELPPVVSIQKWIPVSERLPKSSGVYIVSRWFSDGEESEILTDANYYDGNGYWYNDNRINWGRDLVTDKIVAWMPLPEPYKAEMESE